MARLPNNVPVWGTRPLSRGRIVGAGSGRTELDLFGMSSIGSFCQSHSVDQGSTDNRQATLLLGGIKNWSFSLIKKLPAPKKIEFNPEIPVRTM